MRQDVAVVDETWKFDEVGFRDGEVGVGLQGGVTVAVGSPPHADDEDGVRVDVGCIFPSLFVGHQCNICRLIADIFVSETKSTPCFHVSSEGGVAAGVGLHYVNNA